VKNPQLQDVIEAGATRPELAGGAVSIEASHRSSSAESDCADSLDVVLDYGIVMEAVRDAVRANP
jgi:hypothetical protein